VDTWHNVTQMARRYLQQVHELEGQLTPAAPSDPRAGGGAGGAPPPPPRARFAAGVVPSLRRLRPCSAASSSARP
jgi:hypothetical protein